jgi:iron complex outermembrane receptor protein
MKQRLSVMLASSSILASAFAIAAYAGDADAPRAGESTASDTLEEVIITARYSAENLQNVPLSVSAVTAAQLQDLNLLNMTDLTAVVPGLQIINGGAGFNDATSLRGLSFNPIAGTQNVAAFYINDALVQNEFVTQANYDISQIEVLKGPQGTLRGEPSPAGAITITTHPANLDQYGGYGTVTGSQIGLFNAEAAVNLPIVPGKFAMRLAALIDKDPGSDVLSVNDRMRPYSHTYSERVSFALQPFDALTANLMYQHLTNDTAQYEEEFGPGAPGGLYGGGAGAGLTTYVAGVVPANYNGPPLGEYQRLSADSGPGLVDIITDIGTANINWQFAGQQLTYVGSWWKYHLLNMPGQGLVADQVPGINPEHPEPDLGNIPFSTQTEQTQELRLASNAPDRFWDYLGGIFYREATDVVSEAPVGALEPGSFGSPKGPANPFFYNPSYSILAQVSSPKVEAEFSTFAHVAFHLPDRTEVTVGARYIDYNASGYTLAATVPSQIAIGVPCSVINPNYTSTYPGTCNVPIGARIALAKTPENLVQRAWTYEASISHKFTDNLLAYANSGSSSRPGSTAVGEYNGYNNPVLSSLLKTQVETSYAFEVGLKSTWLDNRARLNLALYHQIYNGLLYYGLPTLYVENNSVNPPSVGQFSFTSNPNAVVNGVDFDAGLIPIKNWTIDLIGNFTHGHLTGSDVPCNPPSGGTTLNAFPNYASPGGTDIFECPGHFSTSTAPNFTATVQSQYLYSLTGGLQAFVRGLLSFYGRNPNVSQPPQNFTVPSYANLNLYLGLRAPDGAWQAMLYAENALDKTTVLNLNTIQYLGGLPTPGTVTGLFGPSGYYRVDLSQRPQYGLKLSYAIGSR